MVVYIDKLIWHSLVPYQNQKKMASQSGFIKFLPSLYESQRNGQTGQLGQKPKVPNLVSVYFRTRIVCYKANEKVAEWTFALCPASLSLPFTLSFYCNPIVIFFLSSMVLFVLIYQTFSQHAAVGTARLFSQPFILPDGLSLSCSHDPFLLPG